MGKVLIVNTLCESLFVYRLTVLPNLDEVMIKKLESVINGYIWGNKRARIAGETLKCDKACGGLRLFDIRRKQVALKAGWIPKIMNDDFLWNCFHSSTRLPSSCKTWIFKCNLSPNSINSLCDTADFWGQVWEAWCNHSYKKPATLDDILHMPIWLNEHIRVAGKPIKWERAWAAGIVNITDLLDERNEDGFKHINQLPDGCMTQWQYNTLKSAFPREWKKWFRNNQDLVGEESESALQK